MANMSYKKNMFDEIVLVLSNFSQIEIVFIFHRSRNLQMNCKMSDKSWRLNEFISFDDFKLLLKFLFND